MNFKRGNASNSSSVGDGFSASKRLNEKKTGCWADGAFELAFDAVERRQRNAAPHAHEADGAVFAIVDELVGETLLQRAIRIDDVGLDRLRV